jgi:hypothetical protein
MQQQAERTRLSMRLGLGSRIRPSMVRFAHWPRLVLLHVQLLHDAGAEHSKPDRQDECHRSAHRWQ